MLAQVHSRTELLDKAIHNCIFDARKAVLCRKPRLCLFFRCPAYSVWELRR